MQKLYHQGNMGVKPFMPLPGSILKKNIHLNQYVTTMARRNMVPAARPVIEAGLHAQQIEEDLLQIPANKAIPEPPGL